MLSIHNLTTVHLSNWWLSLFSISSRVNERTHVSIGVVSSSSIGGTLARRFPFLNKKGRKKKGEKGRRAVADAVNKFQTTMSCRIMTSARDFNRTVRANDAWDSKNEGRFSYFVEPLSRQLILRVRDGIHVVPFNTSLDCFRAILLHVYHGRGKVKRCFIASFFYTREILVAILLIRLYMMNYPIIY